MKTIEQIRAAFLAIHHYATGQTTRAYMEIPANPERDADLIVSAAIDELERHRAAAKVARAAICDVLDQAGVDTLTATDRRQLREALVELGKASADG